MNLTKLRITNLRAIASLEVDFKAFTSLIGPNNTGKSSIFRAIEILLNPETPDLSEWRRNHEDEPIEIVGYFDDIQEWERNSPGIAGLIHNGRIVLRASVTRKDEKTSLSYDAYTRPTVIEGWSERWTDLDGSIKRIAEELGFDGRTWKTIANRQRVQEELVRRQPDAVHFGEPQWTAEHISITQALKQALPQAVYVHAVRDATDDAKPAAKTSFGLLLKRIVLPAIQGSAEYLNLLAAVQALSDKMRSTGADQLDTVVRLAQELTARISSIIDARVVFKMETPETDKFIGTNTGINLDDGTETPIRLQGHGAQRALIFAMIEVLASQDAIAAEDQQRSTVLLFEEPEIYLHPHLMRRLKGSLIEISQRAEWQVAITTHSPFFIHVAEDPTSLVITSRAGPTDAITCRQLNADPFLDVGGEHDDRTALRAALDFHPTVAEAFFARRVVLVEGDTELSVLRPSDGIHEMLGVDEIHHATTTVVSCGGKWTIPAMVKILRAFGVPFRVIHDRDANGRTAAELDATIAIDPYRANARIAAVAENAAVYVVDDTVEHLLWPGQAHVQPSDKPFLAWKRIKSIVNGDVSVDDVPGLRALFQFAYQWD